MREFITKAHYPDGGIMTHDELLDKIYWHWRKDPRGDGLQAMTDYRRTICAVVELHKPKEEVTGMGVTFEGVTTSLSTQLRCDCGSLYPCPTIQTIEKKLK